MIGIEIEIAIYFLRSTNALLLINPNEHEHAIRVYNLQKIALFTSVILELIFPGEPRTLNASNIYIISIAK